MVNLEESDVQEYSAVRLIEMCCKNCGGYFADLRVTLNFSRRYWKIPRDDVSWDAKYTTRGNVIFCDCGEHLGSANIPNFYLLIKKAFLLKH